MFCKVLFFVFFWAVTSAKPGPGNQSFSKDKSSSVYELIIRVLVCICVLLLALTLLVICARTCWRCKKKRRPGNMDVESEENWIDCSTYKFEMVKKPTDSLDDLNKNPKLINVKDQDDENPNLNFDEVSEYYDSEMVPSVDWKSPGEKIYSIETVDQTAIFVVHEAFKPVDLDNIDMKNLAMKLKMMKLTSDQENIVDSFLEDVLNVKMPDEEVKAENVLVTTTLQRELYKDFRNSMKSLEFDTSVECVSITPSTENEFQGNDETEPSNEPKPEMKIQHVFAPSSSDTCKPDLLETENSPDDEILTKTQSNCSNEKEISHICSSSPSDSDKVDHLETENSSHDEFSTNTLPLSSPVSQVPSVESHSIEIENSSKVSCEDDVEAKLTKSRIPFIELLRLFDPNKVQVPVCAVESQDNLSQMVIS